MGVTVVADTDGVPLAAGDSANATIQGCEELALTATMPAGVSHNAASQSFVSMT